MPPDLIQALMDPTAPLPGGWPSGAAGAFLLFLFPVGGGIPAGVLIARDGGVSSWATALLYLISDVLLAFTNEPVVMLLRWIGRRAKVLNWLRSGIARFTARAGLRGAGMRGPVSIVLVAFAVSLTSGRAAAAAAGHSFVPGWSLAIAGDMLYFVLLMGSTLWLSSLFGNDRLTVGIMLGLSLLLPLVMQRLLRGSPADPSIEPRLAPARATNRRSGKNP